MCLGFEGIKTKTHLKVQRYNCAYHLNPSQKSRLRCDTIMSKLKTVFITVFSAITLFAVVIALINVYLVVTYYSMPRNSNTLQSVSIVQTENDTLCVVFPYNYDYGFILPSRYRIRLKLNDEFIPRSDIRIRTTSEPISFRYYEVCAIAQINTETKNTVTTVFYSSPIHVNVNEQEIE